MIRLKSIFIFMIRKLKEIKIELRVNRNADWIVPCVLIRDKSREPLLLSTGWVGRAQDQHQATMESDKHAAPDPREYIRARQRDSQQAEDQRDNQSTSPARSDFWSQCLQLVSEQKSSIQKKATVSKQHHPITIPSTSRLSSSHR